MFCNYGTLQNRHPTFRSPQDYQSFDFQFPQQLFKTTIFKQPNQISNQLTILSIRAYLGKGKIYHRQDQPTINGIKVVFKCKTKGCKAKFIYFKKNTDQYMQLIQFNTLHIHKKLKDIQSAKKQQITQFILHLRGQQFQQYRKIQKWRQRFELNYEEGLSLAEQVYWFHKNQDQILTTVAYLGNTVRRIRQNDKTILIYLQTQGMRQSYLKYGQVITFQFDNQQSKTYSNSKYVGYFLGQDQNMRLVLFAICIIFQQTTYIYQQLFTYFLQTTCQQHLPFAFVTNQKPQIIKALSKIKQQNNLSFAHVHPWYHITRYFKSLLKHLPHGQQIMQLICQILQQSNQIQYQNLLSQLKKFIINQQTTQLFTNFIKNQSFYSLSKIKSVFLGFSISTSYQKTVMSLVSKSGVYRVGKGKFFHRLLKIQHQLKKLSQRKFRIGDNFIKDCPQDFKCLYQRMQNSILQILIIQYHKSLDCKKSQLTPLSLKITQKNSTSHICTYSLQFDHWQCPCKHLILTGIPCSHLLRILLDPKYKASLLYYVNSRWVYDQNNKVPLSNRSASLITNKKRRP